MIRSWSEPGTATALGLRLGRWGIAGFSLAAFVLVFVQTIGFYRIAGNTVEQRAAFGAQMAALAAQLSALFPPPLRPDTAGGYVEFRGFHPLAILFSVWALASVIGFVRGDEERGVVAASLSTGIHRAALIGSRATAFVMAATVASVAAGLAFAAGTATAHDAFALGGVVGECADLAALTIACYGVALLVAEVAGPRLAPAAAGAVLLVLFLVNSTSRVLGALSTVSRLSPFRYYELSAPLAPGGPLDWRAVGVLVAIASVSVLLAALAFARRDVNAALFALPARPHDATFDPAPAVWRVPVLRELYEQRLGLAAWALGMAVAAAVFVALTRTVVNVLLNLPSLLPYLSIFVHRQLYPAVLGYTWFNVAQLLIAAFALAQVARWAAEDGDGRLELYLSQPRARAAVVVERAATLAAGVVLIAIVTGLVLLVASHEAGIDLDRGRVVAACSMLVPFALVFSGAGALLSAWNPRAAVGGLGAFAFLSYLDTELATIFRLPGWVEELSAFRLFGTPLLTGVDARNLTLLVCLAIAGLGASILAMERRDVGA